VIHSGCSRATVSLALQNGTLCLHVIDDGRGFDRALLSRINGLENMRLRVAKAGGTFSITSAPGQGTDVCATLTFPR
jgi:signal transduction histidine kinase